MRRTRAPLGFPQMQVRRGVRGRRGTGGVSVQVHQMLMDVANSLVAGGQTGIFTPMHLLVFRKPMSDGDPAASAAKQATNGAARSAKGEPGSK